MRRSTAVIISAFLVVVVLASPSSADYKRVDPDDVSWTPDIGLVSTDVQQARDRLNILVSYHDGKSHWWKRPAVHMLMDTRRTSRPDYLISIFWKNVGSDTKVHCRVHRMTPSGTRPAPRIIVTSWGYGTNLRSSIAHWRCTASAPTARRCSGESSPISHRRREGRTSPRTAAARTPICSATEAGHARTIPPRTTQPRT